MEKERGVSVASELRAVKEDDVFIMTFFAICCYGQLASHKATRVANFSR